MTAPKIQGKRLRKFYYLSLLCLFPGFGIFIGVVLLFYAIFIFRNIRLVITILLTVSGGVLLIKLDSCYLRRQLRSNPEMRELLARQAADDLDHIAQNLELFKVKYDRYPDSLPQLLKQNPILNITDLLSRHDSATSTFKKCYNYKKSGDNYVLFSVGLDGIPHTEDDIYPRKPLK